MRWDWIFGTGEWIGGRASLCVVDIGDSPIVGGVVVYSKLLRLLPFAVRAGWGWDEDLPFRPWPAWHFEVMDKGPIGMGRSLLINDLAIGMLGLYVAFSWWRTRPVSVADLKAKPVA